MRAILGDLLDLGWDIFYLREVDVFLRFELIDTELAFVVASIDRDDAHAHCYGVLDSDCNKVCQSEVREERLEELYVQCPSPPPAPITTSHCPGRTAERLQAV